jgi:hypothetical protein
MAKQTEIQKLARSIAQDLAADLKRGGREETQKTFAPLPALDDATLQRVAQKLIEDEEAAATLRKLFVALPTLDAAGLRLVREAIEEAEDLTSLQKSGGGRLRERQQHPAEDGADPEALDRAIRAGRFKSTDILRDRAERTGVLEVD